MQNHLNKSNRFYKLTLENKVNTNTLPEEKTEYPLLEDDTLGDRDEWAFWIYIDDSTFKSGLCPLVPLQK